MTMNGGRWWLGACCLGALLYPLVQIDTDRHGG
jgi:hypothetical protein